MQPSYVSVPRSLRVRDINGYSDSAAQAKEAFHRDGLKFLRALAKALGLSTGSFDVRSNKGGIAVSGEVTLHSDDLYLQLSESCMRPGIQALYRTCNSRTDYCGHQNRFAGIDAFVGADQQLTLVMQLRRLIEAERQRKTAAQAVTA